MLMGKGERRRRRRRRRRLLFDAQRSRLSVQWLQTGPREALGGPTRPLIREEIGPTGPLIRGLQ
jgi:hypothetical protein